MKWRALCILLCLFALVWPLAALAADVEASLDRHHVELGETVTLNLRSQGGLAQTPDLSVLSRDFAVLGSSSNTSISIINGRRSAQVTIGIALRPLHTGILRIPSLTFAGGTSQPLELQVDESDPRASASGRKDVFLEAAVDPADGYVGQQRVYTLRLFFAADLTNGALEDPQLAGVDVRRLGNEINYQAERGGRRYNVIERRYALTPQREGHLEIPPVAFQGDMVNMADPDAFFGSGTPVSASSPTVSLDAKPAAARDARATWLPARDLRLSLDGGPAHGDLRVGQPLNLVMSVQATGLPYEALPALSLPPLDGATVYPDKPVNGTHVDGSWLVGRRQQGFAIVPNRPGKLVIPQTTLTWWNVVTDHAEVARIPAQTFTVLPAANASPQSPAASQPAVTPPMPPPAAGTVVGNGLPWRWLALGSFGLWLLSLLGWWWLRRRAATVKPATPAVAAPSSARLRAAFLAAARGGDAGAQVSTLLAWARAERPSLQNLGELALALSSASQREAIDALQRRRYAGSEEAGLGDRLAAVFRDGFAWREAGGDGGHASPLPPLYPFNLHR